MAQSFTNLLYHIVFSTKHRQESISDDIEKRLHRIEKRLHRYLGGIVRGQGGIAIEITGMPDHVHILAKLSQNKSVADVLRDTNRFASSDIYSPASPGFRFAPPWALLSTPALRAQS